MFVFYLVNFLFTHKMYSQYYALVIPTASLSAFHFTHFQAKRFIRERIIFKNQTKQMILFVRETYNIFVDNFYFKYGVRACTAFEFAECYNKI